MSKDLNSVTLIGRLTHDSELKTTTSGKELINFSIASNGYKDEDVSFFNVTAWGKLATNLQQYLVKGKQIALKGELQQQRWESHDQSRSKVIITAFDIQLLGSRADQTKVEPQASSPAPDTTQPQTGPNNDDIPF